MTSQAQSRLVRNSKPAPTSITKWRRPDKVCCQNAQVSGTQISKAHFQLAQPAKRA
jgi:hypothetical protein